MHSGKEDPKTSKPFNVSNEEYAKRWDAIFGRDQDVESELANKSSIKEESSIKDKLTE